MLKMDARVSERHAATFEHGEDVVNLDRLVTRKVFTSIHGRK
jgi:hypothetical protein